MTARNIVTGIKSRDTTSVVGCPITKAGLIPILSPALFLYFFAISSRVASEIGFRPSIKRLVIRGINSITAPILIPRPNMLGMLSTTSFQLPQPSAPIPQPITIPRNKGSPIKPNFFFNPSESIFSLSNPGILSNSLLITIANGTKLWQKGCGIEIPSILS